MAILRSRRGKQRDSLLTTSGAQASKNAVATPCPAAAPLPVPAAPAAPAAPAKPAWEVEWERLLAEAQKEGKVTIATSAGALTRRAVVEAFRLRFGIPTEWLAGTSGGLTARIKAERRARIYSVDATILGGKTPVSDYKPAGIVVSLDNILFLPDLTDPQEIQKMWRFGLDWVDKDHTILNFASTINIGVVVNTQLVQPGEDKSFPRHPGS